MQTTTKAQARRAAILEAALACFVNDGFEATGIEQIRQASGASVGSIYHHFGSKEDIAAQLYVEGLVSVNEFFLERLKEATSTRDAVRSIVLAYTEWMAENPNWARYLLKFRYAVTTENAELRIKELSREYRTKMLTQVQRFGDAELKELSSEVMVAILVGPAHMLARHWLGGHASKELSALSEQLADTAWDALRAT